MFYVIVNHLVAILKIDKVMVMLTVIIVTVRQ